MSKKEEDEQDGEYTDYLLLSSSDFSRGWKHNIMKLAPASASDATDPHSWTSAKLNRRDMRRVRYEEQQLARKAAEDAAAAEAGGGSGGAGEAAAGAGVGSGELKPGMPGFAVKQEIVKEERDESLVAPGLAGAAAVAGGNAPKAIARPKRGFGAPKKTRRVFMTDESQARRRVQFEERHPWVLETTDDKKPPEATRWIGKMDAGASAQANGGEGSSYALFVLDTQAGSEAAFKVVPANRWYKFTSRPKYHVMTMEEAEEEYKSLSKAGDMDTWFSQRRALPASSAAGQSSTHSGAGRGARGPDSFMATGVANAASSYAARLAAARGREDDQVPRSRLKLVHADGAANDAASYGDEEPAGPSQRRAGKTAVKPRRRQELADDQYEEFEFEDDFQDDEEGIGQVGDAALDADDNKELEERIKREMRQANQVGEGIEDLDEDDGVGAKLTRAGKRVQKLLKKKGRKGRPEEEEDDVNEDDDDDDDDETRNPYASDEADGTDSEAEREEARARQSQNKQATIAAASMARPTGPNMPGSLSRNGSGAPGGANAPKYPGAPGPSADPSRANSAGPSTSGPGSRATSPQPGTAPQKRAGTPSGRVKQSGSRAASPTPPPSATKRKAEEGNSPNADASAAGTGGGGKKRRKPGSPSPPPPAPVPVAAGDDSALIPRADIIAFIGSNAPTTKELLRHFKVAMARDPRNRDVILQVTKEVASINAGKLTLKPDVA